MSKRSESSSQPARSLPERRASLLAHRARPWWGSLALSQGFNEGSHSGVDRRLWAVPPGAARALSPAATKPAGAVLSLTGNDHYRFRPPGGETATTVQAQALRPAGRLAELDDNPVDHSHPLRGSAPHGSASAPSTTTTRRPSCATACHACSAGQPCGFSARSDLAGAR